LLLVIAGMHYLDNPVASFYAKDQQIAAAKAWEYILTNAFVCVVLALLGSVARKPFVWPVVLWGVAENAQRSVCRLARPIGGDPPEVPLFSGLCGVDFYWLGIVAALILAVSMADKLRCKQ
jgi:hypothetical protein